LASPSWRTEQHARRRRVGDEPALAVEKPRFRGGGLAARVDDGHDRALPLPVLALFSDKFAEIGRRANHR